MHDSGRTQPNSPVTNIAEHPQNDHAVELTPASSSEPVNVGEGPDPAGSPYILNNPHVFN